MTYILMNRDTEALRFDLDEYEIEVLDNGKLPFALRDYVKDTSRNIKETMMHTDCIKDFLCSRILSFSRPGAKELLGSAALTQSSKTSGRLKISFATRGLTVADNYWLKEDGEDVKFDEVCLRKRPLSEKSYPIAIIGQLIPATAQELCADLSATGASPKFWRSTYDSLELWKTDKADGHHGVTSETDVSKAFQAGEHMPPYVKCRREELNGLPFSVSGCFVDDSAYFVTASDMNDYLTHTKSPLSLAEYASRSFPEFADMVVCDYVFANTGRHLGNWGFLADSDTDGIIGMAPLFGYGHALFADYIGTDMDAFVYGPTGMTFAESVETYAPKSRVELNPYAVPWEKAWERYRRVTEQRAVVRDS